MHVLRFEDFMNGDHTWFERTFRYAVYRFCEPVRRPKGEEKSWRSEATNAREKRIDERYDGGVEPEVEARPRRRRGEVVLRRRQTRREETVELGRLPCNL